MILKFWYDTPYYPYEYSLPNYNKALIVVIVILLLMIGFGFYIYYQR